ncbi:tetratricopeptide repeat protein [Anabaenopsis sp. FSS-46]|uniref:tetratricopeptide repeat protein n=1 Tax=Anabaenopsis sp. FSS-46 TaxID=2971766 RepID=UPI0024740EC3|nr:tetratricopeptide repeat protein [Anabaenopsis sp. FSS-46]MDH6100447.1 tetratricopeptide repeat protein [Anabaenopsis sp. FSS-46]
MELIGLTKAVALTTLTFTLSATPTWGQTNQNQALTIKNSQVVSQRPPILYSQSPSNRALAETYIRRGMDYYKQRNLDLALFNFTQAIKLNPNYAEAYFLRGGVYFLREDNLDLDLALADLNLGIRLNPNYAEAYFLRASVYRNQEKWDLALADYNKVIAISPNTAHAYYGRGEVYRQIGNISKARSDYQQAAELYLDQQRIDFYQRTIRRLNSL